MWRVAISDTVTVLGVSDAVSLIEKATLLSCFWACAEAWQGVGSMESKLGYFVSEKSDCEGGAFVPFAQEIPEVCDRVGTVPDKLSLCLSSVHLFPIDIG